MSWFGIKAEKEVRLPRPPHVSLVRDAKKIVRAEKVTLEHLMRIRRYVAETIEKCRRWSLDVNQINFNNYNSKRKNFVSEIESIIKLIDSLLGQIPIDALHVKLEGDKEAWLNLKKQISSLETVDFGEHSKLATLITSIKMNLTDLVKDLEEFKKIIVEYQTEILKEREAMKKLNIR